VITQLFGAFVRAILVALLVATPSLILPGASNASLELSMIFALIGAAIVLFEYGSSHPGLVEFRFAPPFNRIRFLSLFLSVLLMAIMLRGDVTGGDFTRTVVVAGDAIGRAMDFPFSPVTILTKLLAHDGGASQESAIRSAAGISYAVSLLSLAIFAIVIRVLSWPLGRGNFNVWVNLPTFDPASTNDVENRLTRDARVNIIFGFTLPFLVPMAASLSKSYYDFGAVGSHQTLIWMVSVWAFLPASLFMRGLALGKIARLIRRKRAALNAPNVSDFAPV